MEGIIILEVIIIAVGIFIVKTGILCENCGGVMQDVEGWDDKRQCHRCGNTITI